MNHARKFLSPFAKAKLVSEQEFLCAECAHDLKGKRVEFDHVRPLALGGTNDADNWQALCRECHAEKTARSDIPRIAKAKRQAGETGQQKRRAERKRPLLPSRPFGAWRGLTRTDIRFRKEPTRG